MHERVEAAVLARTFGYELHGYRRGDDKSEKRSRQKALGDEWQVVREHRRVERAPSDDERQPPDGEKHERVRRERPESFYLHERRAHFFAEWNARVFEECKKNVRNIFRTIGPAAVLEVDIFCRTPEIRRDIGIHGYRVRHRHHVIVAVVANKKVPKDTRILRDDILLP